MQTITLNALVVYESMFGGTESIARAIANGLEQTLQVRVGSVEQIPRSDVDHIDLLVVGGPTHAHSMSTPASRTEGISWTHDPAKKLALAPGTHEIGVREWMNGLTAVPRFATFDTRASIPKLFSGAASHSIARELIKRGGTQLLDAESFLVDSENSLAAHEIQRAIAWGDSLATALLDRPLAS
jgi:hypothetical protein